MKTIYVKIDGMHCSHCETTIRASLLKIKNIKSVEFEKNIAVINYTGEIEKYEIIRNVIKSGYVTKDEYISEDKENLKTDIELKEFIFILSIIVIVSFLIYRIFNFNIFNFIPTIDTNITLGMLLITGFFTSLHCISMCGSLNLVATVDKSKSIKKPILYNLGRLISYTFIGGLVGLLGSLLSINDMVSGIIIAIAGVMMFIMSLNMLGVIHIKSVKLFNFKRGSKSPFLIGLLNGFMPCGPMQAMQVYALSTGSFFLGALSMFLFCLGTIPLMFVSSLVFNIVKGEKKIVLNKIAAVLIFILSLSMFIRGLSYLNINLSFINTDNYVEAKMVDGKQVIEFDLTYDNYQNMIVHKGIPVEVIIHVDKKYLTGCNNELKIKEYGINKKLEIGENIVEFTPDDIGEFTYSCWMNMITNKIKVIK